MFKLHFGLGVVVSAWGICVQSQAAILDKAEVKQTLDWQCDMFCEYMPTANYTSQNNCSLYSPMICCRSCLQSLTAVDVEHIECLYFCVNMLLLISKEIYKR